MGAMADDELAMVMDTPCSGLLSMLSKCGTVDKSQGKAKKADRYAS